MSPSRPSRLPWPLRARFLQWVVGMGPQAGSVLWESCPRPTGQFFKRCGDRSPGVAPGIGRERVGGGSCWTRPHTICGQAGPVARRTHSSLNPGARPSAVAPCVCSVRGLVAGAMALTGQRDQGAFSGGRGSNQDGHLGLSAAVLLDCSEYR